MSEFYLVKDGPRTVSLATERDGKLYAFVPNVSSFVYSKPMSVDFQIDREMTYEPVSADAAADIVRAGSIGEIDESANQFLIDHVRAETHRISPKEILGPSTFAEAGLMPAQVTNVIAQLFGSALGRWITYGTYTRFARQFAAQLASDLSAGVVPGFTNIPLRARVRHNTHDDQIVEVSRAPQPIATRTTRTSPRKAVAKVAAKKTGDKSPVKAARGNQAAAAKASPRASAKSRSKA